MKICAYKTKDNEEVISLWNECGLVVLQNDPAKNIERKPKVDPDLFIVGVNKNGTVASVIGGYKGTEAGLLLGCQAIRTT